MLSCGFLSCQCSIFGVQFLESISGVHFLDFIFWNPFSGVYFLESIFWRSFSGVHFLESVFWSTFSGIHFLESIFWYYFGVSRSLTRLSTPVGGRRVCCVWFVVMDTYIYIYICIVPLSGSGATCFCYHWNPLETPRRQSLGRFCGLLG